MINRIKTGDRVEIGFKSDQDVERRRLTTVVEAAFANGEVLVLMPMSAGAMVRLPSFENFEARFYTGPSVLVYDVAVVDHPIIDGMYLTRLRLASEGERIQLRDFYRITSNFRFNFSLAEPPHGETQFKLYEAMTKDLSAGGMNFETDVDLHEGAQIFANFVFDGELLVVIVRALGKQDSPGRYKYQYRSQFLSLSNTDQEKIMKFINKEQYKAIWNTRDGA